MHQSRNFSIDKVLDCCRGLAALWVFLFHIADVVAASCPRLYPLAVHGYLGVPVFFVISGYCIFSAAQSVLAGRNSSSRFLRRRLIRIFPPFWLSILVVALLPYLIELVSMLKTGHYTAPAASWKTYSLPDWLAIFLLLKEPFDWLSGRQEGYTLLNSVYWTLAIEVQFYLVVYSALKAGDKSSRVFWAVSATSLLAWSTGYAAAGFFLVYWPAFACGIVLRLALTSGWTPRRCFRQFELPGALLSGTGAALVLAWMVASNGDREFPFLIAALFCAPILWCAAGVEHACLASRRARSKSAALLGTVLLGPFILLGHCSYSLYLLHGKIYHLPEMFVRQLVSAISPAYLLLTVCATIVICYGFYRVIELPLMRPAKLAKPAASDSRLLAPPMRRLRPDILAPMKYLSAALARLAEKIGQMIFPAS